MPRGPLVPDPPDNLANLATRDYWPAGTQLFRCHRGRLRRNQFNPGYGAGGRFHFFESRGKEVPVLYAGDTRECALFESVFHHLDPSLRYQMLTAHRFRDWVLSEVALTDGLDLALVQLHHPGLGRLGVTPRQLTATRAAHYDRTVLWAAAVHEQLAWAQGLVWMSARMNTSRALMLFGDRVGPRGLIAVGRRTRIDRGSGWRLLSETGSAAGFLVSRPTL
jgi:hypothetical protein